MVDLRQSLCGIPIQYILHAAARRRPAAEARRVGDSFGETVSGEERQAAGVSLFETKCSTAVVREPLALFKTHIS